MTHKEDKKGFFVRLRDKWNAREARRKEKLRAINEKYRGKMKAIQDDTSAINEKYKKKMRVIQQRHKHRMTFEPRREESRESAKKLLRDPKNKPLVSFIVSVLFAVFFISRLLGEQTIGLIICAVIITVCVTAYLIILHDAKLK